MAGDIKHRQVYVPKTSMKQPGRYGWGWPLWLGLILITVKDISFVDYSLRLIAGMILLLCLISYFVLRARLLRWSFTSSRPWIAAVWSGTAVYVVCLVAISLMVSADSLLLDKTIQSVDAKYRARAAALEKDGVKWEAKLISSPRSARDIRQNVRAIDAILAYHKDKHEVFHEMIEDYRAVLKGKRTQAGSTPFEQSIDEIASGYDTAYEKRHNCLKLLRAHYLTGKKKYHQGYENADRDATQSAVEVRKRIAEVFGEARVILGSLVSE